MTTEPQTEREQAWASYPNDAAQIDAQSRASPNTKCRQPLCRAPVWWGRTVHGKLTCFDIRPDGTRTGTNHHRTCRDRPGKARSTAA